MTIVTVIHYVHEVALYCLYSCS